MLGSWSPMSLSMGYSSSMKTPLHTASSASSPSSPSFSSAPTYSPSPDMLAQAVGGGGRGGHGASDGAEHILQASTVHQGLQGAGGQEPQTKDPSTGGAYGPYATPSSECRAHFLRYEIFSLPSGAKPSKVDISVTHSTLLVLNTESYFSSFKGGDIQSISCCMFNILMMFVVN